jgi:hypothetical protein
MQIIKSLKATTRLIVEMLSAYDPAHKEARRVTRLEKRSAPKAVAPLRYHLEAAIQWLKRAQDATNSGGVAWGYRARRPVRSNCELGWVAPYPETTGYTIPTMLRFRDLSGDEDCLLRAKQMVEWELGIQFAIQQIFQIAQNSGIRRVYMKTLKDNVSSQSGILKAGLHLAGAVTVVTPPGIPSKTYVVRRYRMVS